MNADCDVPVLATDFQWKTESHPFRCTPIGWRVDYFQQLVESIGRFGRSRLLSNYIILQIVIFLFLIADQNILIQRGSVLSKGGNHSRHIHSNSILGQTLHPLW